MKRWIFLAAILWIALVPSRSAAWNQSEITWLTITTEHFSVQYHKGLEGYAERAAAVAESEIGRAHV